MWVKDIDTFTAAIPTAVGTEWSSIAPFLETASLKIQDELTGTGLYQAIEAMTDGSARKVAEKLESMMAYLSSIPFVDLIQTNSGFAVVSGSSQAPASKERVERLILWVETMVDGLTDLLIRLIVYSPELRALWTGCPMYDELTSDLFMTGSSFANYTPVVSKKKRETYLSNKLLITAIQENELSKVISRDYLQQLLTEARTQQFTPGAGQMISYSRMLIGTIISGDMHKAREIANIMSNILDNNLETYATYASSAEYALRTAAVYENKQDDPVYFFGM